MNGRERTESQIESKEDRDDASTRVPAAVLSHRDAENGPGGADSEDSNSDRRITAETTLFSLIDRENEE